MDDALDLSLLRGGEDEVGPIHLPLLAASAYTSLARIGKQRSALDTPPLLR